MADGRTKIKVRICITLAAVGRALDDRHAMSSHSVRSSTVRNEFGRRVLRALTATYNFHISVVFPTPIRLVFSRSCDTIERIRRRSTIKAIRGLRAGASPAITIIDAEKGIELISRLAKYFLEFFFKYSSSCSRWLTSMCTHKYVERVNSAKRWAADSHPSFSGRLNHREVCIPLYPSFLFAFPLIPVPRYFNAMFLIPTCTWGYHFISI